MEENTPLNDKDKIMLSEQEIMQNYINDLNDAGFNKMMTANFRDILIGHESFTDVQKLVDVYGHLLTEKEVERMRAVFPDVKFKDSSPE